MCTECLIWGIFKQFKVEPFQNCLKLIMTKLIEIYVY